MGIKILVKHLPIGLPRLLCATVIGLARLAHGIKHLGKDIGDIVGVLIDIVGDSCPSVGIVVDELDSALDGVLAGDGCH